MGKQEKVSAQKIYVDNDGEELRPTPEKPESNKSVEGNMEMLNKELKDKMELVTRTNSELENLIQASDIATILLDRRLNIRRYTARTAEIFNLIPDDIGRPLEQITHQLSPDNFQKDAAYVLRSLQPYEREVHSAEGRIFMARFSPYRTMEGKTEGVVITFFDISERRQNQQLTQEQTRLLEMIVSGTPLDIVLRELCNALPRLNNHFRAGVLLANEARSAIDYTIATEIPSSFGEGVKGAPVNELFIGTCGTAIYEGKAVTSSDIQKDEKWSKMWRDLCEKHEIRACHSTPAQDENGKSRASFLITFEQPHEPSDWERRLGKFGAYMTSLAIQCHHSKSRLKENELRQHFLLQFSDALRPLPNTESVQSVATKLLGKHLKTSRAVYVQIPSDGAYGISKQEYTAEVPGFTGRHDLADFGQSLVKILSENHTVIVTDVQKDDRLTKKEKKKYLSYAIQAAVNVPLMREGSLQAFFSVHQAEPRIWTDNEITLIEAVAERLCTAIDRVRVQEALHESEKQLARELTAMQQLQYVSNQLIMENDLEALFGKILTAAITLMKSDAGSLQMFYPEKSELHLLASRGLHPEAEKFWEKVTDDSSSICGAALAANKRIIVPNIEVSELTARSKDVQFYRLSGIRAVQSTPLISRSGKLVGMLSTHWHKVHQPSKRDVYLLDVVGRQIADLIERIRSEETLRESEENYRAIVRQAVAGILKLDMSGHIVFANDQFGKMLGYSTEELLQMEMVDLVHEKDQVKHTQMFDSLKKGREYVIEKRLVCKDGTYIWVNNYNAPIFAGDGNPQYASIISVDISDRKAIEKKKNEFIGIASHELKTPLTSIKAYAEILQEMTAENQNEDFTALIKKLNIQVDRMNRLVYELLDTNRITEGRIVLARETFDLNSLIKERVEEVQLTAPTHKLIIKPMDKIAPVNADRDRIGQVLINLISNAIKYSPEANEVIISTVHLNTGVRVNVRDFGIGLTPERRKKIFKRFYRVPSSDSVSGFGLGLYISKEIIKLHGGVIGVEEAPSDQPVLNFQAPDIGKRSNDGIQAGAGSLFYFILPYEPNNMQSP